MKNFLKTTIGIIILAILILIVRGKNEEAAEAEDKRQEAIEKEEEEQVAIAKKKKDEMAAKHAEDKAEAEKRGFIEAKILYTFDGDTIQVSIDGKEETLRFIGVDTPESVNPDKEKNTPEGKVASEFTKGYMKEGHKIYLEFDEVKVDKYERTLAYVWLSPKVDTDSYDDFCKYNYGAILLQRTYCRAEYIPPNGRYYEWYKKLEDENQENVREKYEKEAN